MTMPACTNTQTRTHTLARTHTHTQTHTLTHTQTRTHARMHAHTHAHTHEQAKEQQDANNTQKCAPLHRAGILDNPLNITPNTWDAHQIHRMRRQRNTWKAQAKEERI